MFFNYKESIQLHLQLCRWFGLWPNDNERTYKISSFIFHLLLTMPVIFSIMFSIFFIKDLAFMADVLCIFVTMAAYGIKLLFLLYNKRKIENALNFLMENQFKIKSFENEEFLLKEQQNAKFLMRLFIIGYFIAVSFTWIFPFFSSYVTEPLPIWTPFDFQENKLNYWLIYFYIILATSLQCVLFPVVDTLPSCLTSIIIGQIQILRSDLKKIGQFEKSDGSIDERRAKEDFRVCVENHKIILKFVFLEEEGRN